MVSEDGSVEKYAPETRIGARAYLDEIRLQTRKFPDDHTLRGFFAKGVTNYIEHLAISPDDCLSMLDDLLRLCRQNPVQMELHKSWIVSLELFVDRFQAFANVPWQELLDQLLMLFPNDDTGTLRSDSIGLLFKLRLLTSVYDKRLGNSSAVQPVSNLITPASVRIFSELKIALVRANELPNAIEAAQARLSAQISSEDRLELQQLNESFKAELARLTASAQRILAITPQSERTHYDDSASQVRSPSSALDAITAQSVLQQAQQAIEKQLVEIVHEIKAELSLSQLGDAFSPLEKGIKLIRDNYELFDISNKNPSILYLFSYILEFLANSRGVYQNGKKIDEGNLSDKEEKERRIKHLIYYLDCAMVPEVERADLIQKIEIALARVIRPKWTGRLERGGELATLSAPKFLRRVHADYIDQDGLVENETIRAIDPDLMRAVESYISNRKSRPDGDMGDAKDLRFILAQPSKSIPRSKADKLAY